MQLSAFLFDETLTEMGCSKSENGQKCNISAEHTVEIVVTYREMLFATVDPTAGRLARSPSSPRFPDSDACCSTITGALADFLLLLLEFGALVSILTCLVLELPVAAALCDLPSGPAYLERHPLRDGILRTVRAFCDHADKMVVAWVQSHCDPCPRDDEANAAPAEVAADQLLGLNL